MLFSNFSTYLQKLESTPSRLAMTEILAELFRELSGQGDLFEKNDVGGEKTVEKKDANQRTKAPKYQITNSEISQACYLMQGRLVPRYESLEFQLSAKMVIRSLSRLEGDNSKQKTQTATSSSLFAEVDESFSGQEFDLIQENTTKRYKKLGDVGLLAEEIMGNRMDSPIPDPKSPTISDTYKDLVVIAQEGGSGSQERKLELLVALFKKLDAVSAKFVARVIIGKLRLGFSTMTMFDALSWAKHGDKSASKTLEMAYQKKADIGKLAEVYLLGNSKVSDEKTLENYSLEIGVPVVPALCQRLNSAAEIIEKMGEVLAEPKYDGLRIQIHMEKPESSVRKENEGSDQKTTKIPNTKVPKYQWPEPSPAT